MIKRDKGVRFCTFYSVLCNKRGMRAIPDECEVCNTSQSTRAEDETTGRVASFTRAGSALPQMLYAILFVTVHEMHDLRQPWTRAKCKFFSKCTCATGLFLTSSGIGRFAYATHGSKIVHSVRALRKDMIVTPVQLLNFNWYKMSNKQWRKYSKKPILYEYNVFFSISKLTS